MNEEKITVTVLTTTLDSIDKFHELQKWAWNKPGIGCGVFATPSGDLYAQLDGTTVPTAIARTGDIVRWDGARFTIEHPAERFDRGGLPAGGSPQRSNEPEQVLSQQQTRDAETGDGTATP